ncbi:MAG: PEP/pyruvate-binding domain-containing protein [Thermoanaerobaculales bacterium]|jgi:hypothetical protein|nr:PEP/pyruvate-binding domain-containing protein [Thermoanaerobaculales bacterium]
MALDVIGTGPAGFTAAGLDLLGERVLGRLALPADAEVSVEVPAFAVIAADVYSAFLERNLLEVDALEGLSDRQIARRFVRAELPPGLADELAALVRQLDGPLAVRPSSVLEAEIGRSFGGAYVAKLIPNAGADLERRRRQLADAVRLVWASTFFADAVSARLGAGHPSASERMAVVVQRAVGAAHGSRFYPTVSAVARSTNHYPVPGNRPEEGVVTLALGFGGIIAEGHAWSICPKRPTAPPPFKSTGDLLKYSQTSFLALDVSGEPTAEADREDEFLRRWGLGDAEADGVLALVASTYDAESDRLRAGIDGLGPRVLTFLPLLRSRSIPFVSVVQSILDQACAETESEVEIELAACLDPATGVPVRFGLVQLKTMPAPTGEASIERGDLDGEGVIVASESCLGCGVRTDIDDVVYIKPEAFDRTRTRIIASELEAVNRGLLEEGRPAIFIGYGRWGTTDDRYGVPVRWGQISAAQVIVELALADAPLNLSQGTHFFHHLLSQKVLVLSIEHGGATRVSLDRLATAEPVWEGRHVRHVRFARPLEVVVDGSSRLGVIRHGSGG